MRWARTGLWLCAAALCVNLASCNDDDYDDSELRGRLEDVEKRLQKLEEDMNAQIQGLQELINGKVTVSAWTYDEEAGCYKVMLSDNTSFEVEKHVEVEEVEPVPVIGVARDENNAFYWTLNAEPLLNDKGEKIYLETSPAPCVRIAADGELEISTDGGVTYVPTGIKPDKNDNVSPIKEVTEDEDYVYFTLTGTGTVLKVPKTKDFKIALLACKQYFAYGQARTIKLDMSGVKKKAVFSKPAGWKATLAEDELTITAPAAANEAVEEEGSVIVQAWFNDGTSDISEVAVVIGTAPHEVTVGADMTLSFSTSDELKNNEQWQGMARGAMKYSEFSEEQLQESIKTNTRLEWNKDYDNYGIKLSELLGQETVKGETYVVWYIDKFDNYGYENYGELLYTVVTVPDLKIEATDITFEDATISVIAKGIPKYYGGVIEAENYEESISYMLEDLNSPWGTSQTPVEGSYNGPLSLYAPAWPGEVKELKSGTTYVVYAIPFAEEKEYTKDDVYKAEVAIKAITTGGSAAVTIGDVSITMTSAMATVKKDAATYKYWAEYVSDEDMKKYDTDEKLIEYMVGNATAFDKDELGVGRFNLAPETKGWIVAFGVDKNGVAGKVVKKEANTTALTYSSITLPEAEVTAGLKEVTVKIPATAGIKQYKYIDMTLQAWKNHYEFGKDTDGDGIKDDGDESVTQGKLALQTAPDGWTYFFQDAESDGSVTLNLTERSAGEEYVLFVMGVDGSGNPTKMIRVNYTPGIDASKYVGASDGKYQTIGLGNIIINGESIDTYDETRLGSLTGFNNFSADVTLPQNCKKWWYYIDSDEFLSNAGVGKRARTAFIVTFYNTTEKDPTDVKIETEWYNSEKNIYLIWQDNDGNYYEYQEIKPADLKK